MASATHLEVGSTAPLYDVDFSPWIRRIAIVLFSLFLFGPALALFAPWQQNVPGAGQVAAFTPLDRPQIVQAPIKGRVVEVHVIEGQIVTKGQELIRMVDVDPQKLGALQAKIDNNVEEQAATLRQIDVLGTQVGALESARDQTVAAAGYKIDGARFKQSAAEQQKAAAEAMLEPAIQERDRIKPLVPRVIAELKLIEAEAKVLDAVAKVAKAEADIQAARADIATAERERDKALEEANAKIQEVQAKIEDLRGKLENLRAKAQDLGSEFRQQESQVIPAPLDGRVFRLSVVPESSIVKEGEPMLEIVPDTGRPAVELWVRGVDAPLIEAGRKVRLQFEGWPAIQFVGWPAVAVGTFGGVVSLVDPTDSGNGRFRLLIVPDPEDEPWPSERWLRQGVRAKGWVLLNEVPLWFELWRQLNGFPPVVALTEPDAETSSGEKK